MLRGGSIKSRGKMLRERAFSMYSDSLSLTDAVSITSEFGLESTCGRDKQPICLEEEA